MTAPATPKPEDRSTPLGSLEPLFEEMREMLTLCVGELRTHICSMQSEDNPKETAMVIREAMRAANTAADAALKLTNKLDELGETNAEQEVDFEAVKAEFERRLLSIKAAHYPE